MGQHQVDAAADAVGHGSDLGRHVQRVGGHGKRQQFQRGFHPGLRQGRHGQVQVACVVGHEHTYATRRGHHAHVAVGRQAAGDGTQVGDVQHLLDGVRAVGATFGEHGVEHGVVAGQRAGVGAGGRGAQFGAAHLHDEHRLAGRRCLEQCGAQARAVTARLQRRADHAGVGVFGQVVDALGHVHIGLVAGGHDLAETHATQRSHGVSARTKRATLGGQGNRPGLGLQTVECGGKRGEIPCAHVEQTQRVGPHHAHTSGTAQGHQPVLLGAAFWADLGKTRRQHQHTLHALGDAVLHGRFDTTGGHHDDGLVQGAGDGAHAGESRQALHLGQATFVDWVDAAGVAGLQQKTQHAPTNALGIGRGADHGDRGGFKKGREAVSGHRSGSVRQVQRFLRSASPGTGRCRHRTCCP